LQQYRVASGGFLHVAVSPVVVETPKPASQAQDYLRAAAAAAAAAVGGTRFAPRRSHPPAYVFVYSVLCVVLGALWALWAFMPRLYSGSSVTMLGALTIFYVLAARTTFD